MKKSIILAIILVCSVFSNTVFSQNNQTYSSTEMPGDNLNLYGVLTLFQESETLEGFEQKLNAEDSKINNLDLDGNGQIDYIKVIDHVNGSAHTIILQDVINENESQDVAVIEVDRGKDNQILIQIIGDEQLYGKDYIVEPINGTPNPGYSGNPKVSSNGSTTVVNNNYYNNDRHAYRHVNSWGIIRFIFAPSYVVYVSPWRWSYYPSYWHPWRQMHYMDYHSHWNNHHSHNYFHKTHTYNVPTAHGYYGPRRTSSVVVHQRIEKGEFNTRTKNIDSRQNNIQTPVDRRNTGNDQYKGENRRTVPDSKPRIRPETPVNNYSRPNPAERPDRRPDTRVNERKAEKSNTRQEIKQNTRQEIKQNTRQEVKQNTRSETKQEKANDTKRR
jgi:hypothetical protein